MAKLSAYGRTEVDRWFDFERGSVFALMSDGTVLQRNAYTGTYHQSTKFVRENDRGISLTDYLAMYRRRIDRNSVARTGRRCECSESHHLGAWAKAGRPEPCPCPNPVPMIQDPTVTRDKLYVHPPSGKTLMAWSMDSVCEATDGCTVEPDGTCEHGSVSWLRVMHLV
jgi:hypothetical protein